jgi:Domain of unknown function (DUF3846)
MAKAYWIDSKSKTITEVEYNSLDDMHRYIGGHIEVAHAHPNGDVLYVDEEGLLKDPKNWFLYAYRSDQPLAGNGLYVGREVEGEQYPNGYTTLAPTTSIEQLRGMVMFVIDMDELDNLPIKP